MNAARRVFEQLGAAGIVSLGLLLFCAFFFTNSVQPLERELEERREAAERLRSRAPVQIASAPDKADEVRRFYGLFPPVAKLPDELERIYRVARDSGLQIQQGEYRLESRGAPLLSYRVNFPIRGTYAQIRRFVGTTLKDVPIASVDALRFERKRVADAQLEGQVRLTIHFRREGEEPPRAAESEDKR